MYRSLLAAAASLFLLGLFVVVLGPGRLAAALARTDPAPFALGLVATVAALACWSEGLRPLLARAGGPAPPGRLFFAYTAAMFGRQVVPVGALAGPAVTAFAVDREVSLSYNETLATVTVAEFLATVASLVLAAAGVLSLAWGGAVAAPLRPAIVALAAVSVAFAVLALAFVLRRRAVERTLLAGVRVLGLALGSVSPRLGAAFERDRAAAELRRFYGTVDVLAADRAGLVVSYAYHQAGWVLAALPLYTSALALGVDLPLSLVFFLVPASLLVDVLPLPGGLGGVEFVLTGMLVGLAGIDAAVAGAVVVLHRVATYWFLIAVGAAASLYLAVPVRALATDPGTP